MSDRPSLRPGADPDGFASAVGAFHLFLAGAANAVSGAVLSYAAVTDRLLVAAIEFAPFYLTGATALRWGGLIAFLVTDVAAAFGALLVLVGAATCLAVQRGVLRERPWHWCLGTGVCNALNPLALPLALIGVTLVGVSRRTPAARAEQPA